MKKIIKFFIFPLFFILLLSVVLLWYRCSVWPKRYFEAQLQRPISNLTTTQLTVEEIDQQIAEQEASNNNGATDITANSGLVTTPSAFSPVMLEVKSWTDYKVCLASIVPKYWYWSFALLTIVVAIFSTLLWKRKT